MKRFALFCLLLLLAYALTGVFVVRGNEQAVVRWFGKAQPQLVTSGLHWGLPWPLCRVDRVNLNETRTVTVGLANADEVDDSDFLKPLVSSRQSEYLTGDKNILHLQISVQYRIDDPLRYLLLQESPNRHLRFLTQSLVSDVVARSGVDYVHPLGLNALRQRLTIEARRKSAAQELGVFVEDVILSDVRPPVPVKQAFLDVSNARAEKERVINEAQTQSERSIAQAEAQASRLRDQAVASQAQELSAATAEAGRFNALVDQFNGPPTLVANPRVPDPTDPHLTKANPANPNPADRSIRTQARTMTLQRLYWTTLEELLPKLARQIYVDGQKPVDLTIQRRSPNP